MSITTEQEHPETESTLEKRPVYQTGDVGEAPIALLIGTKYALGLKHFFVVLSFGVFFVLLTQLPLWHTDLWGHVMYGEVILDYGIPTEDPFLKLAEGMPVVATMWLSQAFLAAMERAGGAQWLSNTFSLTILSMYVVLSLAFYVRSGRLGLAMFGAGLVFLITGIVRHTIIRPEMFGGLAFAVLLLLVALARRKEERNAAAAPSLTRWQEERGYAMLWIGVPLVFALWCNLHGSYMVGLGLLGCFFLGNAIEVAWRTRDAWAVARDRSVQRWFLVTELAVLCTFLNPYGVDLFIYNLTFSRNPNLADVTEWIPLVVTSKVGFGFACSWVLLLIALRHSRRPVRVAEVLAMAIFTFAALRYVRMLGWYAPVVTFVLLPHVANIVNRFWAYRPLTYVPPVHEGDVPVFQRASYSITLCCLGLVWISFALSAMYYPIITGHDRKPEHLYGLYTPRKLTAWLRENRPEGQVWNTQMWGDWIAWDGHQPGTEPLQIFANTNIHLLPPRVWNDYMNIFIAGNAWEANLDRYDVQTVIVDKSEQSALTAAVRRSTRWQPVYEDSQALVAERVEPASLSPEKMPQLEVPAAVDLNSLEGEAENDAAPAQPAEDDRAAAEDAADPAAPAAEAQP